MDRAADGAQGHGARSQWDPMQGEATVSRREGFLGEAANTRTWGIAVADACGVLAVL